MIIILFQIDDIGPAGVNFPSKGIYSNGSTTTTAIGNSGNIITNNDIHDIFANMLLQVQEFHFKEEIILGLLRIIEFIRLH